jgi:hypothetical protein
MRRLLALAAALLVAACYAELDWRELHWEEGGVKAMLPAKPAKFTRDVVIAGGTVPMQMLQVQLKGMAFGIAFAPLPPGDPAKALASARDVLVQNIDGRVVAEREVEVPGATAKGREFRAEGTVAGTPMLLAGRVAADRDRLYEVVFVGRKDRAEGVDLDLFLSSLRIVPR